MLSRLKQVFTIDVDYSNRVYGFDIMRGIGILVVVYAHGRSKMHFFPAFNDFVSVIGFWLMDLFFVLSGFLIGMILIKFYTKEQTFNLRTAYNFWIRRWFRTLPNYYLVLFLTALLWGILSGNWVFFKLKFLLHALFLQTIVTPPQFFMMEAWTLCIEEWFYLLFPVLLLVGNKLLSKREASAAVIKTNMLIAILIFFTVPMVLRILLYVKQTPLAWMDMSRMTFFRLDTIAMGILMAWINFYYKGFFEKRRKFFGVLFLLLMAVYLLYFYKVLMPEIDRQTSVISFTLFFLISSGASLCLTVYMKEVKMSRPHFFARFITVISLISYSMYIFHRSVVMYVIDETCRPETTFDYVFLFVVYFSVSVLFSILVYKYFEHPMTELREKMKK
jgi:peptidoglycan/LPS O-acetylase OafA/YrhL